MWDILTCSVSRAFETGWQKKFQFVNCHSVSHVLHVNLPDVFRKKYAFFTKHWVKIDDVDGWRANIFYKQQVVNNKLVSLTDYVISERKPT